MVFSSMTFLFAFLPITLLLYYAAPRKLKNPLLALSGIVFYAWGEPYYVFLMLFTILVDYGAGLLIERYRDDRKKRLLFLILSVVLNLGFLGLFKYGSFVVQNINALFGAELMDPKLALPIGISFYTFQAMSYTIDLYRGNIKVQRNVVNFAAYVTMFPQLIAGPIVRYSDVEQELAERTVDTDSMADGISFFIRGLAKKVLLANNIGLLWTTVKAMDPASVPVLTAWIGILAFAFQIYFDFSGYSDMAVGLGRMLGFHFPQNFDHPYVSKSITEFWRRWHITLSAWFRSYVYIPLGGNRGGAWRTIRNLAVVWLLTGLWHGASWNFVLWGAYFGLLLILEKFVWGKALLKLPGILQWLYTFLLVLFGWVLFEMNTPAGIGGYFTAMFGLNGAGFANSESIFLLLSNLVLFFFCAVGSATMLRRAVSSVGERLPGIWRLLKTLGLLVLFGICICYLVTSSYNPFLYFNF